MSNKIKYNTEHGFTEIHLSKTKIDSKVSKVISNSYIADECDYANKIFSGKTFKNASKSVIDLSDFELEGDILDIGGGGEAIISKTNLKGLTVIDLSLQDIKKKYTKVKYITMDAKNMSFEDGSFNTVTSFFVLMYMSVEDNMRVFKEVHRVLKNEGQFIFWDVNIKNKIEDNEMVIFPLEVILKKSKSDISYCSRFVSGEHIRNLDYYKELLEANGFQFLNCIEYGDTIMISSIKK